MELQEFNSGSSLNLIFLYVNSSLFLHILKHANFYNYNAVFSYKGSTVVLKILEVIASDSGTYTLRLENSSGRVSAF
jgi:hypothetical protein